MFWILFGLIALGGRYIYEHFIRLKVEVLFVKINDPNCNCYTNSSRQCENKNCPSKMMSKIISKIASAKKSIDIAMFNFTNTDLAKAIIKAHRRGILIRIIVDKSADENEDNHSQVVETLKFENIDVRRFGISNDDAKKLMHHKFCVIDHSSSDGVVITGSMNWTHTAFKQCENVLLISNVPIQKQYKAEFNDLWFNAVHQNSSSNSTAGNKMVPNPNTVHNNPIDQRILWTKRENRIDFRNNGHHMNDRQFMNSRSTFQ